MTDRKTTKRALLGSVISLLLCFAMLLGTTFAWFTDNAATGSNVIKSGNLDVVVEYTLGDKDATGELKWADLDKATNLFQKGLWEPGHTEVVALRVTNNGSLALKYTANMNINDEDTGLTKDGKKIVLSEILTVESVKLGQDKEADVKKAFENENGITYTTNTSFKAADVLGTKDSHILYNGDSEYVIIKVDMDETVGNEANHNGTDVPSITFGINVFATQYTHEEDTFGDQYDANAPKEGVKSAEEFKTLATTATADGEAAEIILGTPIAVEGLTYVNFANDTVIEGNGKNLVRETASGNPLLVNSTKKVTFNKVNFVSEMGSAVLATRKEGANIELNGCVFQNNAAPSTGNTGVQVYASNVTMVFNNCTFNNMPVVTNSSYPEGIKLEFNNCTFNWTGDNCPGFIQIANNLKITVDINDCTMNYTTDSQYNTAKTMITYNWPEACTININGLKVNGTRNNDKIWKICSSNNKVTVNTSGTLSYTFNGAAVDFDTYLK